MAQLRLEIVTQEKELFGELVDFVSAPTQTGEVTILPHHLSLFTKLDAGEVKYSKAGKVIGFVISGGFMDVSGGKMVVILADSAIRSDQINVARAEEAKKKAEETLKEKQSKRDFMLAEAELRRAIMELKVARKKRQGVPSSN